MTSKSDIPAVANRRAGIHNLLIRWIPALAGMTVNSVIDSFQLTRSLFSNLLKLGKMLSTTEVPPMITR